jgi:DNA-binding PadR family transcriptional regulator
MKPLDLVQGTLDMLILKTLCREGKLHRYAIAEALLARSDVVLRVEEGTLYPALNRLEINRFIDG